MIKLMIIGVVLSVFGFVFYFLSPSFFEDSVEMGRNGALILFAFGWALSGGSYFFNLGVQAQKNRGQN